MHNISPLTDVSQSGFSAPAERLFLRLRRRSDVKLLIFFDMSTKILLFSRPQIAHTQSELGQLWSLFERYGFDYAINQEFAEEVEQVLGIKVEASKIYGSTTGEQPADTVMVCCGGDGTLLEGIHRLSDKSIPVAGINFGHLGFLTSARRDGVEALFDDIANHRLHLQPRTMLEIEGIADIGGPITALNEVAAQRLEATMIKVEASVNSQTVAQYNGDGVIVSTPTGSTGYNMSAGGPIVEPKAELLLITPICPHTLNTRSIILSPEDKVEVRIPIGKNGHPQEVEVNFDGNHKGILRTGDRICITKSGKVTKFVRINQVSFLEVLHKKMSE